MANEQAEPQSREELIAALEEVHREAGEVFAAVAADKFFIRPEPEKWSPGEHAIHLVKSVKAVADAMKMPKLSLRALFGTAKSSGNYTDVRERYLQALAEGAAASGRFLPSVSPGSDDAPSRERALKGWQRAGESLVTIVDKWREDALDKYRMPHPVLGKLSVREMLFFTHYHDLHHIKIVRRIASS